MKGRPSLLIAAILLLFLAGSLIYIAYSRSNTDNFPKGIQFQEIKKGSSNSIIEKQNIIIKSEEEWKKIFSNEPVPSGIDFNKEMIIVVFQGQKSTGGYSINVDKIIEQKDSINIYLTETSPGEGCIVTQAFTSPYQIVKIAKTGKPTNFNLQQQIHSCE
ncbi:MAG: protease complex subunit PrcB family protein [Nanoarchaeota archaeon]|nr:protease complex subunit PrcB family protein [Nanoarchaeota archaeon]